MIDPFLFYPFCRDPFDIFGVFDIHILVHFSGKQVIIDEPVLIVRDHQDARIFGQAFDELLGNLIIPAEDHVELLKPEIIFIEPEGEAGVEEHLVAGHEKAG